MFASELVPRIFDLLEILPILSFDGFFFQNLYNECRTSKSVESVASKDEIESVEKYFDLATSEGKRIKDHFVGPTKDTVDLISLEVFVKKEMFCGSELKNFFFLFYSFANAVKQR